MKKIRDYGKFHSLFVGTFFLLALAAEKIIKLHEIILLLGRQMEDTTVLMKKADQLKRRIGFVNGLHFFSGNIENDPVVTGVLVRDRFGHVDQVGINEDQIPFSCNKISVIEKKEAFALQNIKNLVFVVEMFDTHVEFSVAYHMFKGNAIHFIVTSDLFHGNTCFLKPASCCEICFLYLTSGCSENPVKLSNINL